MYHNFGRAGTESLTRSRRVDHPINIAILTITSVATLVQTGETVTVALKRAAKKVPKRSLASWAFGPAAEDFGQEVRPLGQEVGELSVRAVRTLLKPLGGLVWGFEKVEEWIAEAVAPRISKIPEESRIEPKLLIAGPTIDAMKYCGSEPHLRDLFANLLATAMDARAAANVHPAFVEIIKQLSADEAKMVQFAARGYKRAFAIIETYQTWSATTAGGKTGRAADKTFGPYTMLGFYAGCGRLKAMPSLIGNLLRLQIMDIEYANIPAELLEELLADPIIANIRAETKAFAKHDRLIEWAFEYNTGWLEFTPLGQHFADACVREGNALK